MSMPAETPWLLTTLPSRTHRTSRTTSAPSSASRSSNAQCVANRLPLPTPEANSSSEPVQTLATQFAVALTPASQRSSTGFSAPSRVPSPPGTMTTSSGGWSAKGDVRQHAHALAAPHRIEPLGHEHHAVRRCALLLEQRRRRGEHLPRTDEVELLRAVEHHDPDRAHRTHSTRSTLARTPHDGRTTGRARSSVWRR